MRTQLSFPGFDIPTSKPPEHKLSMAPLPGTGPIHRVFLALFPGSQDLARILAPMDALRLRHVLDGQCLPADRLHITLLSLGDYAVAVPPVLVETAMAAAATVNHPPIEIVFDHALSFAGRKTGKNAFVLCGKDTAAVSELAKKLGLALKSAGLKCHPSGKPHMTVLYDRRVIEQHAVEPISWMASEFVLVLSHVGKTRHEWLARWPLTPAR